MAPSADAFPIAPLLPRVRDALAAHPRLVLEAPPGAGKTTQVPLALLDAHWLGGRRIVMLEPRRVAARAAAGFMAAQLGERVGETVGYRIRFENRVSARTRIEVVTEGILTRMLQDDPELGGSGPGGVGAVLFDEFHERHLAGDLGLALALDVQSGLREDLRIVLMSATLDGERLAHWLDAPRLASEGRGFPVRVAHFPARRAGGREEPLEAQVRRAVEHALAAHPGDVLVFLPGQREIAKAQAALEVATNRHSRESGDPATFAPEAGAGSGARTLDSRFRGNDDGEGSGDRADTAASRRPVILPLHGDLPVDKQSEVLRPDPHGRRRVVLATNVAESSVTLPGVRVVVDSGLAREPRFDPNSGFSRLDVVAVSQASADQRAGRAGRVADGDAYRLWPQSQRLEPQRRPEIAQVELAGLALELAAWGSDALRFPDPPPPGALAAARDLLRKLGALSAGGTITAFGRHMLALGTHPRLAAMLLASGDANHTALACDLAALIEARDPLRAAARSDALAARWQALAAFRAGRTSPDAARSALAAVDAAARQWRRRLRCDAPAPREATAHALGDRLLHAFPDRVARQSAADPRRYQLANGRMAKLFDDSALYGEPWLVASELRFERGGDARLLRAAPLDEAELRRAFPDRFVEQDAVRWDAARRALVARRERRFDGIVLDARPTGRVDPERAAQALTDAVAELGLDALPWSEGLRQWRARVRCLRTWMPELGLPDLSDAALLEARDAWLRPAFAGSTRLDALDEAELAAALKSWMEWGSGAATGVPRTAPHQAVSPQVAPHQPAPRRRIDALAPVRIVVPSGQERRIDYGYDDAADAPRPPVLAVKLQELFGLADTPRIADGRVPLTIHLLSPAGRPLQVTQDLRGFWQRTYPEVRKEMKGRYPKHPWPEDPWNAVATHRAKPRGT